MSHKRRLHYQQRSYEKRIAREKEEAELKKKQEEEEQRLKTEEEEKKKKEAENMEKEKEKVKEEGKEEKKTLAQRVKDEPKKAALDQREEPPAPAAQEMDTPMEDVSSSDDSMDCRESRSKQKGRGQTPKLDFGPSKLEMVKEEAAEKKKEEASSSSTAPGRGNTTSLDQRDTRALGKREEAAPTPLEQRGTLKPEIAIDHHNVLEVNGHIYPQSIRSLNQLRDLGYRVHLVSYCGEHRFKTVHSEALGAWDGWASITRTEQRCGPGGKTAFLLHQGISVLMDDTAEILQEALLKGIRVYPITTPHEHHEWNKANKPKGARFNHRYLTDAINCFINDEKSRKKHWQPKGQ